MQAAFKLEGVVVSVGYADYLAETLPLNLRHFDRLMIVTAPEDVETQRVGAYYGVPHTQTDKFRARWGEFHKAKGINHALEFLARDGWVCHLDADIVLPPTTRRLLERAQLDQGLLYGCDRFNVTGFDQWRLHQAMPQLQQDDYHVQLDAFPLAPRFSGERMGGYAPPGFFQLWHAGTRDVRYPSDHTTAAKTDVLFSSQWYRRARALLPEFVAYHLMAEPAAQGANWDGRVTARWGPEPDRRHHHHPCHHRHRHHWHHHHPHPYGPGPTQDQERV